MNAVFETRRETRKGLGSSPTLFSAGGFFGILIIEERLLIHNLLDHFADVRSQ
jgi:hypothetical protein